VPGLDIGKTLPKRPQVDDAKTMPKDQGFSGAELTRSFFIDKIGIDPVVGWLVAIDGPSKGMDYRIRSENNSIGRSEQMRICIDEDTEISRENHAIISYDPRANVYHILPGISKGIVYLNDRPVYAPAELAPFDQIMLGKTTLLFIPLCGEFGARPFKWL
jgi:hypothetical protein